MSIAVVAIAMTLIPTVVLGMMFAVVNLLRRTVVDRLRLREISRLGPHVNHLGLLVNDLGLLIHHLRLLIHNVWMLIDNLRLLIDNLRLRVDHDGPLVNHRRRILHTHLDAG